MIRLHRDLAGVGTGSTQAFGLVGGEVESIVRRVNPPMIEL